MPPPAAAAGRSRATPSYDPYAATPPPSAVRRRSRPRRRATGGCALIVVGGALLLTGIIVYVAVVIGSISDRASPTTRSPRPIASRRADDHRSAPRASASRSSASEIPRSPCNERLHSQLRPSRVAYSLEGAMRRMYRSFAHVVAVAALAGLRRAAARHAERRGHQGGARAHPHHAAGDDPASGQRRARGQARPTSACDVDTDTVTPGKAFTLTHYWKVNKPVADDWKLFVHLEAPDSKKSHLNADHVPIGGKYPVQPVEEGRDHPRHPPRVGAADVAGQRGRDLRRRVEGPAAHEGRPRGRTTARTASSRSSCRCSRRPRTVEKKQLVAKQGEERRHQARRQARREGVGGRAVDGRRSCARWTAQPAEQKTHGQGPVGRQEPLRRASASRTRTSGRRSTSTTTSCGPRRRSRCSSTPTATARPTSSCR